MQAADRIQAIQAPAIPVVAELIRANPGTISLGQGVVHYPPPRQAMARLTEAMQDPRRHRYGHVAGLAPLKAALRQKLARENGTVLDEAETERALVVTAGGNMAFFNTLLAIAAPGDEVILLTPYYFNHEMAVHMAGARPVLVPARADYGLDVGAIERAVTPRTRAIVTVSPNNPTGAVYDEADLRAVNTLCREHRIFHIHDEAYEYFVYGDARHVSAGAFEGAAPHTISLFSLSKTYGFAGWRIGYMVIPQGLLDAVKKIQDTDLICPPVPSQYAALGAVEAGPDYCRAHLDGLEAMRQLVAEQLARLGRRVTVPTPRGAFYFFVRVHTDLDAMALVRQLIEDHRVAVMPGSTFGMAAGCYLRIAYGALEEETVAEAMERLVEGLQVLADDV